MTVTQTTGITSIIIIIIIIFIIGIIFVIATLNNITMPAETAALAADCKTTVSILPLHHHLHLISPR